MANNKINSDVTKLLRSFLVTQLRDAGYLNVMLFKEILWILIKSS